MRKIIIPLAIILISIPLLFSFMNKSKTPEVNSIIVKRLVKNPNSQGWEWREKEVTKDTDIELVLNKLDSLKLEDINQELVYGFSLIVEYSTDKNYIYVFSGNRVNINGKYYGIPSEEDKDMHNLYDLLDYKEKPSKPY